MGSGSLGDMTTTNTYEFFVWANSKAAPFFSDESESFMEAETPHEALGKFVESYDHPCGLFAANVYYDATAFHKNEQPLARYRDVKAKSHD